MSDGQGALSSTVGYSKFCDISAEMFTNGKVSGVLLNFFHNLPVVMSI
jgi:hypothetical protein